MTDPDGSEPAEFALGLEYEYRINRWIGIGAFADYTFQASETVAGVPLFVHIHPVSGLKLFVAPGYRFVEDSDEPGDEEEDSCLARLGIVYGFELTERVGLAPILQVDFIDDAEPDTAFVYGVNLMLKLGH